MLSGINNEITVSFWVYGNASQMPRNTSLLEGYAANTNQRNLNLHLPWSDNNMYFDCGYAANAYDRINKVATAAEMPQVVEQKHSVFAGWLQTLRQAWLF